MKGYKFNTKAELIAETENLQATMFEQQLDGTIIVPSLEHSNQIWYLPWHTLLEQFLGEPQELIDGIPLFLGYVEEPMFTDENF